MSFNVAAAYSARAQEYAAAFASIAAAHPSDVQLVRDWAKGIDGRVFDAGCGPGHWSAELASLGLSVHGVDRAEPFIDFARGAFPGASFSVGDMGELPASRSSIGGVLAWYSLIHHEPAEVPAVLHEFARVTRPGGGLLLGFFLGDVLEPFDHAVVRAYRWPLEMMAEAVVAAGYELVEMHTRRSASTRPHAAIVARRTGSGRDGLER